MGGRIDIDRKKDTTWAGEEFRALDGGMKTPPNYGRLVEAFDGIPREGTDPGDRDNVPSMVMDEDRYRRMDISNIHIRTPLEDYTRP